MFFESIMDTKFITAFVGDYHSGKTTAARMIGMLLFGKNFNVYELPPSERDVNTAMVNAPLLAYDNVDSPKKWLEEKLAVAATGGRVRVRRMYTDMGEVDVPVHSYLMISSAEPPYRSEYIAERLLLMELAKRDKFTPTKDLNTRVLQYRSQIMTEIAFRIQEILIALEKYRSCAFSSPTRMADASSFALKIARHEGREARMYDILVKLCCEQRAFSSKGKDLSAPLFFWTKENPGVEIASGELCSRLAHIARSHNLKFKFSNNPNGFGQALSSQLPSLRELFSVQRRKGHAQTAYYTFDFRKSQEEGGGE
jgi:hypothetical protein